MRTVPLAVSASKSDRRPTASPVSYDPLSRGVNFDAHQRRKAADNDASLAELHPRVRSVAARLSDVAVQLLDAAVRTQEANPSAVIAISRHDAAQTLSVKSEDAESAKAELVRAGYLKAFSDGSGSSGYFVSDTLR